MNGIADTIHILIKSIELFSSLPISWSNIIKMIINNIIITINIGLLAVIFYQAHVMATQARLMSESNKLNTVIKTGEKIGYYGEKFLDYYSYIYKLEERNLIPTCNEKRWRSLSSSDKNDAIRYIEKTMRSKYYLERIIKILKRWSVVPPEKIQKLEEIKQSIEKNTSELYDVAWKLYYGQYKEEQCKRALDLKTKLLNLLIEIQHIIDEMEEHEPLLIADLILQLGKTEQS